MEYILLLNIGYRKYLEYKEAYGLGTDVGVLSEQLQLSGVNISCGYYDEHKVTEYTIIPELQNCLNFMEAILKTVPIDKQYTIKIDYKAYNRYFDYEPEMEPNAKFDDYPRDYDYIPCDHCEEYDCMNCKKYPL